MITTQQPTNFSNIHYLEKQQEENHVILIIVVVLTSQQPKNYSFPPIVIIYFVPYVMLVRLFLLSLSFQQANNPKTIAFTHFNCLFFPLCNAGPFVEQEQLI